MNPPGGYKYGRIYVLFEYIEDSVDVYVSSTDKSFGQRKLMKDQHYALSI